MTYRERLCLYSVQDVLDGVNGVLDTILAPLNEIIGDLVDAAPSFDLPGKID